MTATPTPPRIREVWATNLDAEMRNIRLILDDYPYVSMDTEFPGVVARPIGPFKTQTDHFYQTMRCNVDLLKLIQVGLTFSDEEGNHPSEISTWQFNFQFNVNEDMYAPESIDLLTKAGLDFRKHEEFGIMANDFAELVITSGLVLTEETKWISYHSGYDFAYFVRLLTALALPTTEDTFFELLNLWFPSVVDIRVMMLSFREAKGGLQDLADEMGISRVGTSHQAGSDSLLTASTFFKMKQTYFQNGYENEYQGILYGIGQGFTSKAGSYIPEHWRSGVTIAEREDRSSTREVAPRTQTPAQNGSMTIAPMSSNALQTTLSSNTYDTLGNVAYMRTAMVGGAR